jgi:Zn-dependent protease
VRASIQLGRWFGVPVGLHYSWFVIASLMTLSLGGEFAAQNSTWGPATVWSLAAITTVLFFLCIVLHELAHATVARLSDIPVRGITLFALGGIAQIEGEVSTPGKEFWMAIAGPAASFAIGFLCQTLAGALGLVSSTAAPSALSALFGWLAYINVSLALFNLIPGFPLDGGRVLRAIVWTLTDNADRATRIAARVGEVVACGFIGFGMFSVVARNDFGGFWMAFIGWFLLEGAHAYYLQARHRSPV